jgi:hypothetical protein
MLIRQRGRANIGIISRLFASLLAFPPVEICFLCLVMGSTNEATPRVGNKTGGMVVGCVIDEEG